MSSPDEVLSFWREAGEKKWFARDEAFDAEFRRRFEQAHFAAARGELDAWGEAAESALALVLLLDQFPRNAFRGTGHAFATDGLARHHASRALEAGHDSAFEPALRSFLYVPFMHSESLDEQRRSVALYRALGHGAYLDYAEQHLGVIERFGRFPHRNRALGRTSTAQEQAWLEEGGGF